MLSGYFRLNPCAEHVAQHTDSFRSRHIAELFLAIFGSSARAAAPNARGVVLLATAESQAALHPALNAAHVFREVVALKPPGKDARRDVRSPPVNYM